MQYCFEDSESAIDMIALVEAQKTTKERLSAPPGNLQDCVFGILVVLLSSFARRGGGAGRRRGQCAANIGAANVGVLSYYRRRRFCGVLRA